MLYNMIFTQTARHQSLGPGNPSMNSNNLKPPCTVGPVYIAFCTFLACLLGPSPNVQLVLAHEFPDGHVERSLSMVVQDRKVLLEYAVGCNPNTMSALLAQWQANGQATAGPISSTSPIQAGGSPLSRTSDRAAAAEGDQLAAGPKADSKMSITDAAGAKVADSFNPKGPAPIALTGEEPEIEHAFQTAVLAEIAKQLEITCNGVRVNLRPISVELSPRHHVNALARLEFDLPADEKIRLIAHDELFPDNPGAVKYALKPRQSAIVLKSNVAPILVRAEVVDLTGLSPEIRARRTTVDCELSFLPGNNPKSP
jgi:hypothetical protein